MIPPNPEHSRSDLPKDPEIQGWFHALGPPPVGQVSPTLQVHVRARIAQEQARLSLWTWLTRRTVPAWTAVVAAGLLLVLGVQAWRGLQQEQPTLHGLGAARRLHTYRFQVGLPHTTRLGAMVAAQTVLPPPLPMVGFTPQVTRTAFIRMGVLFADTVVTLQSGALEAAAPRLDVLLQTLTIVQAPPTLAQYLRVLQTLLHSQQYSGAGLASFLSLFEPLYEDAYAHTPGEEVRLFRVGTWIENMALATMVSATTALQQEGRSVAEVRHALTLLGAPQEVLDALTQIDQLLRQPRLTTEDVSIMQRLLQRLKQTLEV